MKCCLNFFFSCPFFKPVNQDFPVPTAIKDSNPPRLRGLCPESPQERMHSFILSLCFDRKYLKSSRIHTLDQLSDLNSLSRCTKAFKNNHHRNFQFSAFSLQSAKFYFHLRHLRFILFFRNLFCQINLFKHCILLQIHSHCSNSILIIA